MSDMPEASAIPPVCDIPPRVGPDGLAIASLVCGICSCVLFCSPILAAMAGVPGLVLGLISKSKVGVRTAGISCSAVGLGISLLWFLITIGLLIAGGAIGGESFEP